MTILGEIERLMASLYPYRVLLTLLMVMVLGIVMVAAYRRGVHRLALRHPRVAGVVAAVGLVVAIPVGNYLLSPLWTRVVMQEASPLQAAAASSSEVRVLQRGAFRGADDFHFGRGQAILIEAAPGKHVLRFENFSVQNGPDLYVYLSPNPNGWAQDALNLGMLRASDGSLNYAIPDDAKLDQYRSAVIWCRRFGVLFATATLGAA
jgi:hypothetical protein